MSQVKLHYVTLCYSIGWVVMCKYCVSAFSYCVILFIFVLTSM